jgi:hypothetical protein
MNEMLAALMGNADARVLVVGFVLYLLLNLVKRFPVVPSAWVPAVSLAAGFAASAGYYMLANLTWHGAFAFAIEAVMTGVLPIGIHWILKKPWAATLGAESADKWLGQADAAPPDIGKALKGLLGLLASAGLIFGTFGCTWAVEAAQSALQALTRAQQGAQYISSLVDYAQVGQSLYFARHPSLEAQRQVEKALAAARAATKALDEAALAAQSADDKNLSAAKDHALAAYRALYELFEAIGIKDALPPLGGAETDAPEPVPLDLPAPDAVAVRLDA